MKRNPVVPGPGLDDLAARVAVFSEVVSNRRIGSGDLKWSASEVASAVSSEDPHADNQWWLLSEDDVDVAAIELEADLTNDGPADCEMWLHPDRPLEVLPEALAVARDFAERHGRRALTVWYWHEDTEDRVDSPAGIGSIGRDAVAGALLDGGARLGQVYRVSAIDPAQAGDRVPPADGYRLHSWAGPTPPELMSAVAMMHQVTSDDAPTGETGTVAARWTAERVASDEATWVAGGREFVTVLALTADGDVAGFSRVAVNRGEQCGWQWDTSVVPAHRGHGLGIALKTNVAALLREHHPEVRRIITHNASENVHMLRINEALGWRPIAHKGVWVV